MKPRRHILSRLTAVCSVVLALLVALPASGARAGAGYSGVLSPQSPAYGKTYAEWAAAWWQYVYGVPGTPLPNPLFDTTGQYCGINQSGPVFFLVGTPGASRPVERTCTVPAGKFLFFPLINGIDLNVSTQTAPELWTEMHNQADPNYAFRIDRVSARVDNVPVAQLDNPNTTPYRTCNGNTGADPKVNCGSSADAFYLRLPAGNIAGLNTGRYGPAAADGIYLLLAPLPLGTHTITFKATGYYSLQFTEDITYTIIVR